MRPNKLPSGLTHGRGRRRPGWIVLLLLALAPASAISASKNEDLPILIEADSADIDDRQGVSVYRGNVEIRQGTSVLTADRVTVQHPGKKAQKIIAVGKPVKYRQTQEGDKPDIRAEALQAEYYTTSSSLVV